MTGEPLDLADGDGEDEFDNVLWVDAEDALERAREKERREEVKEEEKVFWGGASVWDDVIDKLAF